METLGTATLARIAKLGLVVDLDGTLIAHASTPAEARLDPAGQKLLEDLASAPSTWVALVSGRLRPELDEMAGGIPGLYLAAEHGAWRRAPGGEWQEVPLTGPDMGEIEAVLRSIASTHEGALVERKRWSVCLHHRRVPERQREAMVIEASNAIERWIEAHSEQELLEGASMLEVRHKGANKGGAVDWFRSLIPADAKLIALGDDLTDEDAFARLARTDAAIRVGMSERPSRATRRLAGPEAVREFLRELERVRREPEAPASPVLEPRVVGHGEPVRASLVVLSNRLPDVPTEGAGESERARNVGGLVSGLAPALSSRGGVWLGWSGAHVADPSTLVIDESTRPVRAAFDFDPRWHALFYNGFANRALWPIFHSFPGRTTYSEKEWETYVEVNDKFAEHAAKVAAPDATIWAHDYHLLLVGEALRRRGHSGPIGFFLHIPFPPLDLFETIPWAEQILEAMLQFDLVGFHVQRYVSNFVTCARALLGARLTDSGVELRGRRVRVGAFPLGIDHEAFGATGDDSLDPEIEALQRALMGRKLVLGVDRLDYSKGIAERLEGWSRFLEMFAEWRSKVSFVQVAVPSRADVPEYAEQRRAIETLVGRINGERGETHWVPVRYVYRSYPRPQLARLYRAADVGLVTPLRDGMNLVAKEYIAAQDPERPGVLVLSRFAGAAAELDGALLTNPYHRSGLARDVARALAMPLDERIARHRALMTRVASQSPSSWAASFLEALEGAR